MSSLSAKRKGNVPQPGPVAVLREDTLCYKVGKSPGTTSHPFEIGKNEKRYFPDGTDFTICQIEPRYLHGDPCDVAVVLIDSVRYYVELEKLQEQGNLRTS